jgi:glycine cleavage system transcriptional repressor
MNQFLAVSILGKDKPGTLNILAKHIQEHECGIENSRMSLMGTAFAMVIQITGHWNNIAKLESSLPTLGKKHKLTIKTYRSQDKVYEDQLVTYSVDVIAVSNPGLIIALSNFFYEQNINISDMGSSSFKSTLTDTPMISLSMKIHIPADASLSTLREDFIALCDELNVDAILEPERSS